MKTDDTMTRKLTNTAIATLFMVAGGLIDTYEEKGLQHIKGWLENQSEEAPGSEPERMKQEERVKEERVRPEWH